MAEETRTFSPDERLHEAIASFELAREAGANPKSTDWLNRYADVADRLREYFADVRNLVGLTSPRVVPSMALPDIPDYEITGPVATGIGGMGMVFKARKLSTQQIVALKVIRPDLLGNLTPDQRRKTVERFVTEARVAALLEHENIVKVYDVGESDGRPYYAMRYVEGKSLSALIQDGGVSPARAAAYIEQVARAVNVAHQHAIIHRDLKPNNILVESSSDKPLVADFGLAKLLDRDQEMTRTGDIMGAPPYMSPEQALNSAHVTTATDVYGLGATLYALLTSRPPFHGDTPVATLKKVLEEEPQPPRKINPSVPRDVETICLKCLEKDPGKRYGSAAELANDLQCFRHGLPISARPTGSVERAWRWCRRNPVVASASSAAMLASLIALTNFAVAFFLVLDSRNAALKLAKDNGDQAIKERQAKLEFDEARKKAQTLLVQLQFEQEFQQTEEKRALSIFRTTGLLRDAMELENQPLQVSLRLHLANWFQGVHHLKCILSHADQGRSAAFSPDGKTVLTIGRDMTARLWETATGEPLGPPLQHQEAIVFWAFSPDGKTVVTGSSDKTARLWEASTGKPLGQSLQHRDVVHAVAFSPDGKTVVTGSNKTVRLWATATGEPLGPPLQHQEAIRAFSADGKIVVTGSDDNTARLWEAATGKPLGLPMQHDDTITAVAFSPDGKTVVTVSGDRFRNTIGEARLWETATGKPFGPPMQHQCVVVAVAFSPDGKTVLTGSGNWDAPGIGEARLWETATGKPFGPPMQHHGVVFTVAFSPDGKTVLTGGTDKTARLWETATGKPLGQPLQHQDFVTAVALSSDGKTVLTVGGDTRLWETARGRTLGPPMRHQGEIYTLPYSPDGKIVVTGSDDNTARLWEAATGKPLGLPMQHDDTITAVAFSPDGKTVITGIGDVANKRGKGQAQQWETASGKPLGPPLQHRFEVRAVAFSPDGKTVLTGSIDGTARLWEAATGKPFGRPMQHEQGVVAVAFSPDGKIVLTGSHDSTARLWEAATGKPLGPPLQHRDVVHAVAFSPDGKIALTISSGRTDTGTVRLWETTTGKPLGQPLEHRDLVHAVAFSPDGKTLITGSGKNYLASNGEARLWATNTGKPLGPPMQHQGMVGAVAFSRDGKTVLTGSHDKTARLWETATGRPLGPPLQYQDPVIGVAFNPDDNGVRTTSWHFEPRSEVLRLWDAPRLIKGDPEQILLWAQVATGLELDEYNGTRVLDAPAWRLCRQRLQKLGGSPVCE